MTLIHRSDMNGRPRCGTPAGRVSCSGAQSSLTCPECIKLCRPRTRAEQIADLERAVVGFRCSAQGWDKMCG